MKRKLLLLLFISACISLVAREYTVENLPMPRSQGNVYVTNPDGILSSAAVSVMDTTLYALEKQTGIQVLVAAVEQIEGGDCFDFAYRLGRHAGVGEKGRDNGLSSCSLLRSGVSSLLPDTGWKVICPTHSANKFNSVT